jgi:hypothetical protein
MRHPAPIAKGKKTFGKLPFANLQYLLSTIFDKSSNSFFLFFASKKELQASKQS